MIAAANPYQAQIDQLLKSYVQFYVIPRLRAGRIGKAQLDATRAMLDMPGISLKYSASALTVIRLIVDQLMPYAVAGGSLSGVGLGDIFGDAWKVIKGGANWLYKGVKTIFTAGQTAEQLKPQVQLATSQVNNILSEIQRFFSTVGSALQGGAVSTGLSAFWNTTMGKVVIVGGGFLLLKSMAKR
jgi:hypothetical protein